MILRIIKPDWEWRGALSVRPYTRYIVLHHAAAVSASPMQVDSWHKSNGWSGIGYHFYIRKDGSVYEGRPLWATGSHAQGKNSESIGVCVEGNYEIETVMPQAQKSAVKEVLSYIKDKYPDTYITGHRDVGATGCPGRYYPFNEMKEYYNNESEGLTMTQYEELKGEIEKLKAPMIYNYIDNNMPEWAREGVRYCLDNGFIEGTGDGLGLDSKDLKYCTIIMRLHKAVK